MRRGLHYKCKINLELAQALAFLRSERSLVLHIYERVDIVFSQEKIWTLYSTLTFPNKVKLKLTNYFMQMAGLLLYVA